MANDGGLANVTGVFVETMVLTVSHALRYALVTPGLGVLFAVVPGPGGRIRATGCSSVPFSFMTVVQGLTYQDNLLMGRNVA